jgi:uncharacterized protein DUF4440
MVCKRLTALVLSLTATLWLAGCTIWGEHKAHAWTEVTGGESLERVFWEQVKNKKWTELEPHLAATYVLVTPEGSFERAAALEHWKQLDLAEYSLGDFSVQPSGDTYVVAYTLVLRGRLAGQPLAETPLRAMTVWQHLRREWYAIAHSASPATSSTQPK